MSIKLYNTFEAEYINILTFMHRLFAAATLSAAAIIASSDISIVIMMFIIVITTLLHTGTTLFTTVIDLYKH